MVFSMRILLRSSQPPTAEQAQVSRVSLTVSLVSAHPSSLSMQPVPTPMPPSTHQVVCSLPLLSLLCCFQSRREERLLCKKEESLLVVWSSSCFYEKKRPKVVLLWHYTPEDVDVDINKVLCFNYLNLDCNFCQSFILSRSEPSDCPPTTYIATSILITRNRKARSWFSTEVIPVKELWPQRDDVLDALFQRPSQAILPLTLSYFLLLAISFSRTHLTRKSYHHPKSS
jgi:hypothetical protein